MEWRYWITYSGTVEAFTEDEAIKRAMDDADNGKIPEIEVMPDDGYRRVVEPVEGREGE